MKPKWQQLENLGRFDWNAQVWSNWSGLYFNSHSIYIKGLGLARKEILSGHCRTWKDANPVTGKGILRICSSTAWILLTSLEPHHKYLVENIESVQRKFTKSIPAVRNRQYLIRLKILPTLERRRIILDLCFMHKILHGFAKTDLLNRIKFCQYNTTRGHAFKIWTVMCKIDATKFSFINRVIKIWNSVPEEISVGWYFFTF